MYRVTHECEFTLEEYLSFEDQSATKHEYLAGNIYAMAGASPEHNRLVANLIVAIGKHPECAGYASDQKVWVPGCQLVTYPDLTYACDKPRYEPDKKGGPLMLRNPALIIEVLSRSTEAWDRNGKWECYQTIESLAGYMLVAQDRTRVEHFERGPGNAWMYTVATEGHISIPSLGSLLPLAEVYSGIEFPQIGLGSMPG